jgi:hypothetical protein
MIYPVAIADDPDVQEHRRQPLVSAAAEENKRKVTAACES